MDQAYVHPQALVESDDVGAGTRIWAFAHVLSGASIGKDCNVGDHGFIESGATVGNNVTIKNHVCLWDGITIEDDVFLGPGVVFTNDACPRSPRMPEARTRYERCDNWLRPTRVQRGCSVGANATILPGLTLGAYSMIAAGSVVTHDVPPHALVMGVPACEVGVVCRCGTRLEIDDDAAHAHTTKPCPACGFIVDRKAAHC